MNDQDSYTAIEQKLEYLHRNPFQ